MISKGSCDERFIWDPSNCESCDVWQYLDYKNCNCRKELISKLVEKCSKNINENQMVFNVNDYEKVSNSCTRHSITFHLFFNNHRQ